MTPKKTLRISLTLLVASFAFSAIAAPKDGAALKKIDEAINVHYLATEFDKAEAQLLGVIKACGKDCSPNVVAKAYMYIGLVRGSGKQNMAAAKEAFEKAKGTDPAIVLDAALATPEVQAEFNKAKGGAAAPAGPAAAAGPAVPAAPVADGTFNCTPAANYEVQVRQPIPVSCSLPEGVTKGELNYKTQDAEGFKTVPMAVAGKTLRGQIPCDGVAAAGVLSFYVIAQDANGDTIETLGNELAPSSFNVVPQSTQPAPAYPGSAPPARCGAAAGAGGNKAECPPGMPGCAGSGGWGDSCTPAEPCKKGLYCAAGTCENAPSCDTASDCDSGHCEEGFCQMGDTPGGAAKFRRVMLGVHFAPDVWMTSQTDNVCGEASILAGTYSCYRSGQSLIDAGDKDPIATAPYGGTVKQGLALATLRLLFSLDYAFTPNVTVGGRVGYAFHGGPPSIKYDKGNPVVGTKFLPFHVEARAAYYFRPLSMPGIHPYIHVGGGMAQVDGKVKVQTFKCNLVPGKDANGNDIQVCNTIADANGVKRIDYSDGKGNTPMGTWDAWRKMGQGFATVGLGTLIPAGPGQVQVNVNVMLMLPASGTVFEPSLGYVMGL